MICTGVIVTFNRHDLLAENLNMLAKQTKKLDRILIIDNHSTDNTQEIIKEKFDFEKMNIDYRYMEENYGGAGGFYYGVKFARELNSDLIWLMDDDGKPYNEECFEKIYNSAVSMYQTNKKLFLNSLVTCDGYNLSFGFDNKVSLEVQRKKIDEMTDNVLYNKVNPFNGTLVSKELVDEIGYPEKDFFMSRDETDYMFRSINAGALVATINDNVYRHPKSKLVIKNIFGVRTQVYSDLLKEYYFVRNMSYTYMKTNRKKMNKIIMLRFLTILLFENHKIKRIFQLRKAKQDAINGKMGKKI